MKNVCIAGCGAIAPSHAAALAQTKSATLYAACDIDLTRLNRFGEKYDIICYSDYDTMLNDDKIDSIHICTPHFLHFEMIEKALEAGKTVVCEKPVTMTQHEYSKLLKRADSDLVCAVLQNRYNSCVQAAKDIIESGSLGAIKTIKGILTWERTFEYYNNDTWRGKWDTEGGGVLINQAVHTLDLMCYLAGNVKSVKAQMSNFSLPDIEVEDTVSARLLFENGISGIFFATNGYGYNSAPELEIVFENGVVQYRNSSLYVNDKLMAEDCTPPVGKAYWGAGHIALIRLFYEENSYFTLHDISNSMDTLFAIYKSAVSNSKEISIGGQQA